MKTAAKKERIIMGVDPGTNLLGWGIIKCLGNDMSLVDLGVLNLKKIESPYEKLGQIFTDCSAIIKNYQPTEFAIEAPFQGKNVQSMLKLGRAQGVAIAAAFANQLEVFEYAPKKIKQSLTGNGNASKEQLASMVQRILNLKELPPHFDTTDGLATAVCHFYQRTQKKGATKSYGSWANFISQNADRIKG